MPDERRNFNYKHSSTRMVVERSFGMLINRRVAGDGQKGHGHKGHVHGHKGHVHGHKGHGHKGHVHPPKF